MIERIWILGTSKAFPCRDLKLEEEWNTVYGVGPSIADNRPNMINQIEKGPNVSLDTREKQFSQVFQSIEPINSFILLHLQT